MARRRSRAASSVRSPALRSASMAICFPGIASRVKRAATSAMRLAPVLITTNWTIMRMRNITKPTTGFPAMTTAPKAPARAPAAPSSRMSRARATLMARRTTAPSSSRVGKTENSSGSVVYMAATRTTTDPASDPAIRRSMTQGARGARTTRARSATTEAPRPGAGTCCGRGPRPRRPGRSAEGRRARRRGSRHCPLAAQDPAQDRRHGRVQPGRDGLAHLAGGVQGPGERRVRDDGDAALAREGADPLGHVPPALGHHHGGGRRGIVPECQGHFRGVRHDHRGPLHLPHHADPRQGARPRAAPGPPEGVALGLAELLPHLLARHPELPFHAPPLEEVVGPRQHGPEPKEHGAEVPHLLPDDRPLGPGPVDPGQRSRKPLEAPEEDVAHEEDEEPRLRELAESAASEEPPRACERVEPRPLDGGQTGGDPHLRHAHDDRSGGRGPEHHRDGEGGPLQEACELGVGPRDRRIGGEGRRPGEERGEVRPGPPPGRVHREGGAPHGGQRDRPRAAGHEAALPRLLAAPRGRGFRALLARHHRAPSRSRRIALAPWTSRRSAATEAAAVRRSTPSTASASAGSAAKYRAACPVTRPERATARLTRRRAPRAGAAIPKLVSRARAPIRRTAPGPAGQGAGPPRGTTSVLRTSAVIHCSIPPAATNTRSITSVANVPRGPAPVPPAGRPNRAWGAIPVASSTTCPPISAMAKRSATPYPSARPTARLRARAARRNPGPTVAGSVPRWHTGPSAAPHAAAAPPRTGSGTAATPGHQGTASMPSARAAARSIARPTWGASATPGITGPPPRARRGRPSRSGGG